MMGLDEQGELLSKENPKKTKMHLSNHSECFGYCLRVLGNVLVSILIQGLQCTQ